MRKGASCMEGSMLAFLDALVRLEVKPTQAGVVRAFRLTIKGEAEYIFKEGWTTDFSLVWSTS